MFAIRMLTAIKFNNQLGTKCHEINDVILDRLLAFELYSFHLILSQIPPQ